MTCTLCETNLEEKINKDYYHCSNCGAIVKDKSHYLNADEEKKRYLTHNNDVNDSRYQDFTSPITNHVLANFLPSQIGLDFGSGTGPVITKQLVEKGYQVNLYDPFFAPFEENLHQKYDFIFSCEVFEHFYQPKFEINRLTNLLKPDGQLLIMTHIFNHQKPFDQWYYKADPTHVFIYTPKTFDYIAKTFGLKLIEITERFVCLGK